MGSVGEWHVFHDLFEIPVLQNKTLAVALGIGPQNTVASGLFLRREVSLIVALSAKGKRKRVDMAQKKVEIYTWQTCPFCHRAKALLDSKGVEYTEYKIDGDDAARQKMIERAGGKRSLPQIFVDQDVHLGGCDDIYALQSRGKLDELLGLS